MTKGCWWVEVKMEEMWCQMNLKIPSMPCEGFLDTNQNNMGPGDMLCWRVTRSRLCFGKVTSACVWERITMITKEKQRE